MTGLGIFLQRTTAPQLLQGPLWANWPWVLLSQTKPQGQLNTHLPLHLIIAAAHRRAQGYQQIGAAAAHRFQSFDSRDQDSSSHPTPTRMTSCHGPAPGIGQQHWGAVRSADPQTLATSVTEQAIGLRPGLTGGSAGGQHQGTVNLTGLVHTHPGTDIARQLIGPATMPLAREKTVLEAS